MIMEMIARSARWVHPDTFRALPVWYPETARGRPIYDATWSRQYINTNRLSRLSQNKYEGNGQAAKALISALGAPKVSNWSVCHIWGYDDGLFKKSGGVVRDPRYYSCVANMVWLPTPLKGFTDSVPEIKRMLRVCAANIYGWICEHPDVSDETKLIASGMIPDGYPKSWPTPRRRVLPPGAALYSPQVRAAIERRKLRLRDLLKNAGPHFPRDEVRRVLKFWKVRL